MAGHAKPSSQLAEVLRARLTTEELSGIAQLARGGRARTSKQGDLEKAAQGGYQDLLSSLLPSLLDQRAELDRQKERAPALLEELLKHPPERAQVLVRNSSRFLNRPLCEKLHERSLDACFRRPPEAVALAQLAREISDRLPGGALGAAATFDLRARSLGILANAYRVASEPHLAEKALDEAGQLLEEGGSGDLLENAWLTSLRGSLRADQGQFDESFQLLEKAIRIYRQCGERHLLGRTVIYKSLYHGYAGNSEQAISLLREGLSLVDTRREPRLALAASHNLVLYLTDLHRHEEAAEILEQSRPLYQALGDAINLLRLRWLEARMARERNELEEAERAFLETREAFIQEKIAWDVALVSLELAAVYLEQGRTVEIKTLADEMLPIFQATGMHREAMATLLLFHKAAEREKVTAELIRRTMGQLHSLRRDR